MKNLKMTILGVAVLAFALVLNLRHAMDDYGLSKNDLHIAVMGQSGPNGFTTGPPKYPNGGYYVAYHGATYDPFNSTGEWTSGQCNTSLIGRELTYMSCDKIYDHVVKTEKRTFTCLGGVNVKGECYPGTILLQYSCDYVDPTVTINETKSRCD